jgi:hypothetical protein
VRSDAALPRTIWATPIPENTAPVGRAIRPPAHCRTARGALLVAANGRGLVTIKGNSSDIGASGTSGAPDDKGGEDDNGGLQ